MSKKNMTTEWMTAEQATEYLALPSRNVLYQMARCGQVPFYRLGEKRLRFKRSELDEIFEKAPSLQDLENEISSLL
jgi:excisionase family DNA binding protein